MNHLENISIFSHEWFFSLLTIFSVIFIRNQEQRFFPHLKDMMMMIMISRSLNSLSTAIFKIQIRIDLRNKCYLLSVGDCVQIKLAKFESVSSYHDGQQCIKYTLIMEALKLQLLTVVLSNCIFQWRGFQPNEK